jgi:hypothetical protein
MEINLVDLKFALNQVLDHIINKRDSPIVSIEKNLYWEINYEKSFDLSQEPKVEEAGSLHDEWHFARNLVDGSCPPLAVQLTQLAPILMYLGHKLGKEFAPDGG